MQLKKKVLFAMAVATFVGSLSGAKAQDKFSAMDYIPDGSSMVITAMPKAALSSSAMEFVPRELITAFSKQELGIDFCEINRATLVVDTFEDLIDPPGFALTLEFDSAQEFKEEILADAEESKLNDKPLFVFPGRHTVVAYMPNAKTMVIGMQDYVTETLESKNDNGKIAKQLKGSETGQHISAIVQMSPLQDFIDMNLPPSDNLPFPLRPFRDLPEKIDQVRLSVNFEDESKNTVVISGIDEKATGQIMKTIEQGLTTGRGLLLTTLANELDDQPEMLKAIEAYDDRVGDKLEEMLKPKLEGKDLIFEPKASMKISNAATIGTLIGMLLPATQQVRGAARRTQSMNNLRQLALACLNYESAYMHFPQNICDEDGEPLLSWRVAILPFIEQNGLYQQFRLDEPWDSEHNIKLLDKMPAVFTSPSLDTGSKTPYLGIDGEGGMFESGLDSALGFGQITDGSSNTILCVEANEDAAIEWTKPADLEFDPEKEEIEGIGDARPEGFLTVFCDGSTHLISMDIGWESIFHLFQRSDGNVVNW